MNDKQIEADPDRVVFEITYDNPDFSSVIVEDTDGVLDIIRDDLDFIDEAPDEKLTFVVQRRFMTEAELKALPEAW